MDKTQEFISYKKLIIFGAEKVGKTSLIKSLEGLAFSENLESDKGNFFQINIYIFF